MNVSPSPETFLDTASRPHSGGNRLDRGLATVGTWLAAHRRQVGWAQWCVVGIYVGLLAVPAVLPLPERTAHIWDNVILFAQFVFWAIWWPGVLLSMVLVGRLWCGVLCPEGALSERASRHGLGRAIPSWVKWRGWPFVAFVMTTVYGQMISVYQYPRPALLILGGSTVAAIALGLVYGRNKRVWCRHLCPVSGVFGVLTKLAPLHYAVDRAAWAAAPKPAPGSKPVLDCAPLVAVRTMRGSTSCHMCGRCAGYRDAVTLERRSPNHEIVHVAGLEAKPWETALIVFGMMGVAAGAFHWTGSALYVDLKQAIAEWLILNGHEGLVDQAMPWWVLTNYADRNDVMTIIDGAALIGFIAASALVVAASVGTCLALATRALGTWRTARFHHLAQALIPVAGVGLFLGLSMLTVTMLKAEGMTLPFIDEIRAVLLLGAGAWSLRLAWAIGGLSTSSLQRRIVSLGAMGGASAVGLLGWASLFWTL